MTAANEKPDCPCCWSNDTEDRGGRLYECMRCFCRWYDYKRRPQLKDKRDAAENTESATNHPEAAAAAQATTGSITATCETTSGLPYTVGQPAEAVDEAEYTQGLAYDGVVILKDGQPITIDEVLAMLNARARGGK